MIIYSSRPGIYCISIRFVFIAPPLLFHPGGVPEALFCVRTGKEPSHCLSLIFLIFQCTTQFDSTDSNAFKGIDRCYSRRWRINRPLNLFVRLRNRVTDKCSENVIECFFVWFIRISTRANVPHRGKIVFLFTKLTKRVEIEITGKKNKELFCVGESHSSEPPLI